MKLISMLVLCCCFGLAVAGGDAYQFSNPAQQQTFNSLTKELRCLVCQNQSLADSHAELADDLKAEIYQQIQQGASRQQVIDFLLDRYGDFVLYKPQLNNKTYVLWFAPFIMLLMAGVVMFFHIRRQRK